MDVKDIIKIVNNVVNSPDAEALKASILDLDKEIHNLKTQVYDLQTKNFYLERENEALRKKVDINIQWENTKALYEPFQTPGGALIYRSIKDAPVRLLACPNCMEERKIIFIQPDPDFLDRYYCPGCQRWFMK